MYPVFMSDLIVSPPVANAAGAEGEGKEDEDGNATGSVQHRVFHLFCKPKTQGPTGRDFSISGGFGSSF